METRSRFIHGVAACAVWLFCCLCGNRTDASETLSLVVSDAMPVYANPERTGLLDRMAHALFRRLDHPVRITRLPSERALQLIGQEQADGDLFRIAGLENRFPFLIMVPEPWLSVRFVAFTLRPELLISSWQDLLPLHVAFVRGWQVFETRLPQARTITRTDDSRQLFDLLKRHRVDAILYDDLQGEFLKQSMGVSDARVAGGPLLESPIHAYLHRKHADLVPRITAELSRMKQDGTWKKIMTTVEGGP
ncbi:MAG: transporter substrate-binding domain-containing protein [Magnetococcales bacterium]|nr:transporter substrate-binding domain-containing protein [Magnetococcales bacterium]